MDKNGRDSTVQLEPKVTLTIRFITVKTETKKHSSQNTVSNVRLR